MDEHHLDYILKLGKKNNGSWKNKQTQNTMIFFQILTKDPTLSNVSYLLSTTPSKGFHVVWCSIVLWTRWYHSIVPSYFLQIPWYTLTMGIQINEKIKFCAHQPQHELQLLCLCVHIFPNAGLHEIEIFLYKIAHYFSTFLLQHFFGTKKAIWKLKLIYFYGLFGWHKTQHKKLKK